MCHSEMQESGKLGVECVWPFLKRHCDDDVNFAARIRGGVREMPASEEGGPARFVVSWPRMHIIAEYTRRVLGVAHWDLTFKAERGTLSPEF